MRLTCLPPRVSQALRVRKPCFRHRPHLVWCWRLGLHILYGRRATFKALARHGPAHLASQHDRRLLCAASWCPKAVGGVPIRPGRPCPRPKTAYLVGDRTRRSRHPPCGFGFCV
ncbi:MAG: hypothetical protein KatS3mg131_3515 [Candidatus Tectimicrobiota bacterium]|nr:MAG: hypothetical protein KatS3mg131_3515 [Candidatus Tectomicrobia bacterium]